MAELTELRHPDTGATVRVATERQVQAALKNGFEKVGDSSNETPASDAETEVTPDAVNPQSVSYEPQNDGPGSEPPTGVYDAESGGL